MLLAVLIFVLQQRDVKKKRQAYMTYASCIDTAQAVALRGTLNK